MTDFATVLAAKMKQAKTSVKKATNLLDKKTEKTVAKKPVDTKKKKK